VLPDETHTSSAELLADAGEGFIPGNGLDPAFTHFIAAAQRFRRPQLSEVFVVGRVEAFGQTIRQQRPRLTR
jgi:hypothetical protein